MGSTRVVVCAGIILMVMGVIGKFGALFVTIPTPIIGGLFMVMFGKISYAILFANMLIAHCIATACSTTHSHLSSVQE